MWVRKRENAAKEVVTRRPSLIGDLAIAGGVAVVLGLASIYGVPRFDSRTGELAIIHVPTKARGNQRLVARGLLATALAFPIIYLVRRRRARGAPRPSALLCTTCHDAHALDARVCHCGGALEPLDRWEWVEPSDTQEQGGQARV
jgi:hypothetical protein